MKDCPYKWPEKSFIEKDIFSMEKIVGSTLELSAKVFFSLDKYQLKIWVENTGFAIQYIGNNKSFTKVPPPPPDQPIPFTTVAVLHFTHNIKMA